MGDETVLRLNCRLLNPEASAFNPQGFRSLSLRMPVRAGSNALMVAPDTGYGSTLLLPGALMNKVAPDAMKEALPALVTTIGLSGRREVSRAAKLPEFTLGPDTLRGLPVDVTDAVPGTPDEQEGVVGLNLLRHYVMTFSFSKGELRLKPLGTVQDVTRTSTAGLNLTVGDNGRVFILSVEPDGPAAKAGLEAGDELLAIEGRPLKTLTPEEFAAFKQLPPGTPATIRYRRGKGGGDKAWRGTDEEYRLRPASDALASGA